MSCRGCIYKAAPRAGYGCNYMLITGHSRGCPVEGCTVKKTSGQARRKKPKPIILPGTPSIHTAHKTREDRPGTRLTFDEAKALELYYAGHSDAEISDGLGGVISRQGILMWRRRRGLAAKVPQSVKKEAVT